MRLAYAVATPDTRDAGMLALRGPLDESFAWLASLGYAGVDLMVRDPAELQARTLAGQATAAGLRIVSLSTGQVRKEDGLSLSDLDEVARQRAVDRARAIIDLAAALDAQVNIGTLRGTLPTGPDGVRARQAARASVAALLTHAHQQGVRLALEPQCRYVSNWLNTLAEARAFMAELVAPVRAGLVLDLYHVALEEPSIYAAIVQAAPDISLVQVSDSNRLPPGAGHLPFADILRVLAAVGYQGFVAVEALQRPSPREAAASAARHLLPMLERIASERSSP